MFEPFGPIQHRDVVIAYDRVLPSARPVPRVWLPAAPQAPAPTATLASGERVVITQATYNRHHQYQTDHAKSYTSGRAGYRDPRTGPRLGSLDARHVLRPRHGTGGGGGGTADAIRNARPQRRRALAWSSPRRTRSCPVRDRPVRSDHRRRRKNRRPTPSVFEPAFPPDPGQVG